LNVCIVNLVSKLQKFSNESSMDSGQKREFKKNIL
jgi:hypothetical protein